jgi:small conductance mechanosensitive channel
MPQLSDPWDILLGKLEAWLRSLVVMVPNVILAFVIIAIGIYSARGVQRLVRRFIKRLTRNEPITQLLSTLSRIVVIAVSLFFALGLLQLDKTVTSLLAGVGVVGLALGFAFQDIASNFMSGFIMAIDGPFTVGDLVDIGGRRGRIKHIALRASEIETVDGLSILVPNKEIFQNAIVNYTSTPNRRLDIDVGTAYGNEMTEVRTIVLQAVQSVPCRNLERDVEVFFNEFGDFAIKFSVRIWLTKSDEFSYNHARSEAMIAIKRAFDENGITIPFPIRTLDFGAGVVGGTQLDALRLRLAQNASDID